MASTESSPISEVTDGIKARLSGGLIGNYVISFLIYHWKIVLIWVSDHTYYEKVALINGELSAPWLADFLIPAICVVCILLVQLFSGIVMATLEIIKNNMIEYIRLKQDHVGEKFINDMRMSVVGHYMQAMEALDSWDTSNIHASGFKLEAVNNIKSLVTGQLNFIRMRVDPAHAGLVIQSATQARTKLAACTKNDQYKIRNLHHFENL